MRVPFTVALLIACGPAWGADNPKPQDYPADRNYLGRSASPIFVTPEEKQFRTRIREGAAMPVNFAGHYSLVSWGCGTSCAQGAAIDHLTGSIVMLPFSICCGKHLGDDFRSIIFNHSSRLIVFNGLRNEEEPDGLHFYDFDGKSFKFVSSYVYPAEQLPKPTVVAPSAEMDCKSLINDKDRLACFDKASH